MVIKFSKPEITESDRKAVSLLLESDWQNPGEKIQELENRFVEYFHVKHAIAVNSGTSGLHLLIKAFDIREGDEVITSPFSFVASSNCILYEKAIPVFADVDKHTLNIDINKIEEKISAKTKAILPVDIFGQPNDMQKIQDLAQYYHLKVIEDSCEALGSEYNGIKAGTMCDGSVFSFFHNKQITGGEGGIILTNDDAAASQCRSMRSQGRPLGGAWLLHESIGYNYRMSDLNAVLCASQMERLQDILEKRQHIANLYNQYLKNVKGITLPYIHAAVNKMSWFIYVIQIDESIDRVQVMQYLLHKGIETKPYFIPIHQQPYISSYVDTSKLELPVTSNIGKRSIALPFYNQLSEKNIEYIATALEQALRCK